MKNSSDEWARLSELWDRLVAEFHGCSGVIKGSRGMVDLSAYPEFVELVPAILRECERLHSRVSYLEDEIDNLKREARRLERDSY